MSIIALVLIVASIVLVRAGWAGRRILAGVGWTGVLVGQTVLVRECGAWGLAIGTTAGIGAGLAIVLWGGWTAPARAGRTPRETATVHVQWRPSDLARRCCVFALTVPVGFVAAQWLAFGIHAAVRRAGVGATDADVTMLFLQPLLWTILMSWQLTRSRLMDMAAPLILAGVIGTALWGAT